MIVKKYKIPGERRFRDPEKQKAYNGYKEMLSLLNCQLKSKQISQSKYDDEEFLLYRKYAWVLKK